MSIIRSILRLSFEVDIKTLPDTISTCPDQSKTLVGRWLMYASIGMVGSFIRVRHCRFKLHEYSPERGTAPRKFKSRRFVLPRIWTRRANNRPPPTSPTPLHAYTGPLSAGVCLRLLPMMDRPSVVYTRGCRVWDSSHVSIFVHLRIVLTKNSPGIRQCPARFVCFYSERKVRTGKR